MGKALLTANLGEGQYEIELDYGSAEKDKGISDATVKLQKIAQKLAELAPKISKADEEEREIRLQMGVALAIYQVELAKMKPNDKPPEPKAYKELLKKLGDLQSKNQPLRQLKKAEETNRTYWQKQLTYWQAFEPIERRKAWCVDYTDQVQPGRVVKTIEIPGEPETIVIAPRCRAWSAEDGELKAREVQKPHQVFFNAAILPGWQIDKPTYRSGVITEIKRFTRVCSVTLDPIPSSAQGLGINRLEKLEGVPFEYMSSNHESFIEGDHVVIEFRGNKWDYPFVIGFVKEPVIEWSWQDAYIYVSIKKTDESDWPIDGRPGRIWFYTDRLELFNDPDRPELAINERLAYRNFGPVSRLLRYDVVIEGVYKIPPEKYGKAEIKNYGQKFLARSTYDQEYVADWPMIPDFAALPPSVRKVSLPVGDSPASRVMGFAFELNSGAPTVKRTINNYDFSNLTSRVLIAVDYETDEYGNQISIPTYIWPTAPFFDKQTKNFRLDPGDSYYGSWETLLLHELSLALENAFEVDEKTLEIWPLFGGDPQYVVEFRGRTRPYEKIFESKIDGGQPTGSLPGEKDRLFYFHRVKPYEEYE